MALSVYKKGQGSIARLLGAGVGAILSYFSGVETFIFFHTFMQAPKAVGIAIGVLTFLGIAGLVIYYLAVNPKSVDYLIETETEMRKVNWPTKQETIDSTGVVIVCVVILGIYIFLNDAVINVLMSKVFNLY